MPVFIQAVIVATAGALVTIAFRAAGTALKNAKTLREIAVQFATNGGSSLRDVVDNLTTTNTTTAAAVVKLTEAVEQLTVTVAVILAERRAVADDLAHERRERQYEREDQAAARRLVAADLGHERDERADERAGIAADLDARDERAAAAAGPAGAQADAAALPVEPRHDQRRPDRRDPRPPGRPERRGEDRGRGARGQ